MSVKIGQTISHYRILEEIGAGGMAIVYKAEDINLKRLVALKFLPPQLTVNKETRKRFITEAQSASALDHPNICTIFEIGQSEEDQMFIAMGFYEGETLKLKIEKGKVKINEAINITIQIAQGLGKAHEKGIIHRDIKPANIMITSDGAVKILDFGLAKLSGHTTMTKTGTMLGTAIYMSPEQASGEKVDHRSDIWSLGVILYEMLCGNRPFQGDNEQAMVYAILNKDPKPITAYQKDIPDYIEKVIYKSLVKDPDNRYQTIQELVKDLKAKSAPDIDLPAKENSIVVLPFKDFSEKKENEYFSDGLTEEIITDLSQVKNLLVISRSSAMTFKDTKKKITEIGKELNVQNVLEGSVRKEDNNVRITAQLIEAKNDTHLWAEKYSGTMDDIFDIQEKVSRSIVDALALKLSPEEEQKLAKRPIKNIHAYECYLRARQESSLATPDAMDRAIKYIENGLEIIGENAHLYAGLGYIYWFCVNIGMGEFLQKAEENAEKALRLDAQSSEAHLVIGMIYQWFKANPKKGIYHLEMALETNPDDPHILTYLCIGYSLIGKPAEARKLAVRAKAVDPLTPMTIWSDVWCDIMEGKFELPVDYITKWFHMESKNPMALFYCSYFLANCQYFEEARSLIDENLQTDSDDAFTQSSQLVKYAIEGKTKKIMQLIVGDFEETLKRDPQYCYYAASLHALAGMKEAALNWLERAIDRGFINYPFMFYHDPLLESIREEERFKQLMIQAKYEWEHFDV